MEILSLPCGKLKRSMSIQNYVKCVKLKIKWVSGIAAMIARARPLQYVPGVIRSNTTVIVFRVILTLPHAIFAVRNA